jgi:hypothetical protein
MPGVFVQDADIDDVPDLIPATDDDDDLRDMNNID